MPYLPTVKAMAPSTPRGASWMMRPMARNSTTEKSSMSPATRAPRSPTSASAQPKTIENSSTCSTSPVEKALTAVVGMSLSRKSLKPPPESLFAVSV